MFRVLSIGLIIGPLQGHWGFGNWKKEGTFNHYIHHSKFNWNYGSSPMWDHIMGTNYPKVTRNCQVGSQTVNEQGFQVGLMTKFQILDPPKASVSKYISTKQ